MYRIMLVKSKRDNNASLYQWLTSTDEESGEATILEYETESALDTKVEAMLNDDGYSKQDFIVVKYIDFDIEASNYDV